MNDQCKTYDGRYAELNTEEAIKWMNLCFNQKHKDEEKINDFNNANNVYVSLDYFIVF